MDEPIQRGPWCVECKAEKQSANHWFKLIPVPGRFVLAEIEDNEPGMALCGEACVTKALSKWLGRRK